MYYWDTRKIKQQKKYLQQLRTITNSGKHKTIEPRITQIRVGQLPKQTQNLDITSYPKCSEEKETERNKQIFKKPDRRNITLPIEK